MILVFDLGQALGKHGVMRSFTMLFWHNLCKRPPLLGADGVRPMHVRVSHRHRLTVDTSQGKSA